MSDIYTTPKSNLVSDKNRVEGKRPGWVFVISLFYIFSFVKTFLIFYLVFSSVMLLSENQKNYFESPDIITEMIITSISSILSLAAAITLLMLKKLTIKLWLAKFLFDIVIIVYHIVTTDQLQSGEGSDNAYMFAGVPIVIYLYAKRLDARGFLK